MKNNFKEIRANFLEIPPDEPDCEYCEDMILGCSPMTSTFLCEGCACNEVFEHQEEYFLENVVWYNKYKIKDFLKLFLNNCFRFIAVLEES